MRGVELDRFLVVDQLLVRDQFRQDHRRRLERLDLDLLVAARVHVLDAQHADSAFAVDDRDAGERVVFLFARFRPVLEVGVGLGLGEVERFDPFRDRSDQPFADAHPGDVDRFGIEASGSEEFQRAFAQQVDRTDLAIEAVGNDVDHAVELVLCVGASGHDLVKAGEDLAGGGYSGHVPLL